MVFIFYVCTSCDVLTSRGWGVLNYCVVFNSLTKDMTGKEDVYRGPAIRALCRITDVIPALLNSFSSLTQ